VLARFKDDPRLWHHRVVLRVFDDGDMVVVTPDRDVQTTDFTDTDKYADVKAWNGVKLPAGRSKDCYLDIHSSGGAFGAAELESLIRAADGLPQHGVRRRLRAKTDAKAAAAIGKGIGSSAVGPAAPVVPAVVLNGAWLVQTSSNGADLGKQLTVAGASDAFEYNKKHLRVLQQGSQTYVLEHCEVKDAVARAKELADEGKGRMVKDVRVLDVMFDTGDERWRSMDEAVAEYEEVDFEDFL
jgi:hypothetical protein